MTRFASRKIIERIIVEGDLVLLTPTSLGNGDNDGLTDMSLLLDSLDGSALLTGNSIAGALRNYLREYLLGFGNSEESVYKDAQGKRQKNKEQNNNISLPIITQLFGSLEDDGSQSLLVIDDARSVDSKGDSQRPVTELRDGVRINEKTRTAMDRAKFDVELLEAGTTFKLHFELIIPQEQVQNKMELVSIFVTALQGFEKEKIHIGARKSRGYGKCKVQNWTGKRFLLQEKNGLIDWLKQDLRNFSEGFEIEKLFELLYKDEKINIPKDCRKFFKLNACFALEGSMLIRSASVLENGAEADSVHLRSKRNGKYVPILSGTSLAGVLRHRAVKICNTIANGKGQDFVEEIFGVDMKKQKVDMKKQKKETFASRLEVHETVIENTNDLIQTRIKIDRFTGGAYEGALFDAAPVFSQGKDKKAVEISLLLRSPKCSEIGLLLLLLKDLWTSDLAIGGESSIGRGRLKGIYAHLEHYKTPEDHKITKIKDSGNGKIEFVVNGQESYDSNALNKFVTALNNELQNSLEKEQSSE